MKVFIKKHKNIILAVFWAALILIGAALLHGMGRAEPEKGETPSPVSRMLLSDGDEGMGAVDIVINNTEKPEMPKDRETETRIENQNETGPEKNEDKSGEANREAAPDENEGAAPAGEADDKTAMEEDGEGEKAAPEIVTNLKNGQVNEEKLSFTAGIKNGSPLARLTASVNGKTVKGPEGQFEALLKPGNNTVRLKLTDTKDDLPITLTQTFIIRYVPETTQETAPRMRYINVADGQKIRGDLFTLDVDPVDYLGNRIYYDGIDVKLNGKETAYNWSSEYTNYQLLLAAGKNSLEIIVTDRDGRSARFAYELECEAVSDGEEIGKVTISIDAKVLGLGYVVAPVKCAVLQGETGAETFMRFIDEQGLEIRHLGTVKDSFYISRIYNGGITKGYEIPQPLADEINADGLEWKSQRYADSLGEFDFCQGSGWTHCINGSFTGYTLSDVSFKDGDEVKIRFTLAYGRDIGASLEGKNYSTIY